MQAWLPLPPRDLPPPPPYHLPVLVTTYSHLGDRSIRPGDDSMAYYSPAPLGADLSYGFERRVERDETVNEHLDGLVRSIQHVREQGMHAERPGGVITWRGVITRIMTAPFEDREGWEMTAVALAGSVYLELYDPPELHAKRQDAQSAWALQSYMGYSFESFSTVSTGSTSTSTDNNQDTADDETPEGWSGDVNTNVQWCNVVRAAIGEFPLCLGGEVDCVQAEPGSPYPGLDACVELKTNKVIDSERQDRIFHKKLLKHWAQSFLLGVPTIQVGFRDDAGILCSLKTLPTSSIPRIVSSSRSPVWVPDPCLHFLHAVLDLVTRHVLPTDPAKTGTTASDDDHGHGDKLPPAVVWRLRFLPRRGCELVCIGSGDDAGDGSGEGERWGGVLPREYVRWRLSQRG